MLINMATGTVKWFSNVKGVGFISQKNGDDVIVHHSSLQFKGLKTLFTGDKVEFEIDKSQNGYRAAKVMKL